MESNNYYSSVDGTPKTIEELKQWYRDHNLPPAETTRFFIGINYTNPKAFGIYKEGNEFIVYKNKADGTRSIRYQGEDEAYAVKELFLKLKSEISNQKAHNQEKQSSEYGRNSSSDSEVMRVPGNSGSYTGRNINSTMHSDNLGCFGAFSSF